ncbi:MAG: L-lactate dehydrogenase [Candidatus Magasanikbacteria bacterium]
MSHHTSSPNKVAIIGAGAVGSTAAYAATLKNVAAEIVLIDINDTKEEGEVMDIRDGICFVETGCIKGADFKDAKDADVIVVTAGAPQKPGETRLDLVKKNKEILLSIFKKIGKLKPTAIILMIANPVDVLTYLAQEITGLPHAQVFGSGTGLDTARLKTELGKYFNVSAQNIHGYVLGEHGDTEFVAWSTVTIGGVPISQIKQFNERTKKEMEQRVRTEAYEIINRKGATFYGIGLVISEMLEAILYNQHKIMPASVRLENWNGVSNVCIGVPAVIGRNGIEKIWPLKLPSVELKRFKRSAETLKTYLK